jgi:hypothetical protein
MKGAITMYTRKNEPNIIDAKIELLRDLCILTRNAKKQEAAVRAILERCQSEVRIEQKLHDLLCGNETLKEFISRN